jgi:hypothetical protein
MLFIIAEDECTKLIATQHFLDSGSRDLCKVPDPEEMLFTLLQYDLRVKPKVLRSSRCAGGVAQYL